MCACLFVLESGVYIFHGKKKVYVLFHPYPHFTKSSKWWANYVLTLLLLPLPPCQNPASRAVFEKNYLRPNVCPKKNGNKIARKINIGGKYKLHNFSFFFSPFYPFFIFFYIFLLSYIILYFTPKPYFP